MTTTTKASSRPFVTRARKLFGTAMKGPLTLAGLALAATVAMEYKNARDVAEDQKGDKKRVLVLPFHRIKLVERKKPGFDAALLESLSSNDSSADDAIMEVEVKELVDAIHAAAQDPNIVALYGTFGHGFRFSSGGWAHVEEVRNALKVFRESHRVHREPNMQYEEVLSRNGNSTPKPTYAYADSFANPMDSAGNQEFYLASVFSHIHLQAQGECNLFGMGTYNTFFRDFLKKYGITAHVFKHGVYKNAPNALTEEGYTRQHMENVTNILETTNTFICDGIAQMRGMKNFDDPNMWKLVHNHGTFTAQDALKISLVDYTPQLDPLDQLIDSTKSDEAREEMKKKFGKDTDYHAFQANSAIELSDYLSLLSKKRRMEQRQYKVHNMLENLAEKSTATSALLQAIGYSSPNFNISEKDFSKEKAASTNEKIALVRIEGTIDDKVARSTTQVFRKIKQDKDVKCVVLRVDSPGGSVTASETILQECKDLPQPVICSMGNVAASGGYYVATDCDRIFALPTTVTGSIGVFGVKLDFADMAAQYGITRQFISTGTLSSMYDPLSPLTKPMKKNFSRNVDRYYHYFKSIVSEGRGLSMDAVEDVAQGRVWTGDQAKVVGLVDELGGLSRAIAYAQRNYTSGDAIVESWPKPKSLLERLMGAKKAADTEETSSIVTALWLALFQSDSNRILNQQGSPMNLFSSGVVLAMDENLALEYALRECLGTSAARSAVPLLPADFWV